MDRNDDTACLGARPPLAAPSRSLGCLAISLLLAFGATPEPVLAQEAPVHISIAVQPLGAALIELANRYSLELAYSPDIVAGLRAPGVSGNLTADQALSRLLAGTDIVFRRSGRNVSLSRAGTSGAGQLAPVLVQGAIVSATEGTGSYVAPGPVGTATPLGLTLRETPQSVSVITKQRMEDQGLTTIQQALAQVPGVRTGSLGTELGNASSRGYSISNYQVDGVNTFVEVLGGGVVPSSTLADMALYDRIEVLRGASGLVTGAGEPSGTINMVRKKPTADFQAAVELGVGSWADKRAVVDLSGSLNEARTLRGRVIAVGQDADSFIDHYGRRKSAFYGVLEADLTPNTLLTTGVEHTRTEVKGQSAYVGFPLWYRDGSQTDLPVSFTSASRDNWLDLTSTKVFATLDHRFGNDWKLKLSGTHGRSTHKDGRVFQNFSGAFPDQSGNGVALNASQRRGNIEQGNMELSLRGPFTLLGRQHELVVGAAHEDYVQPINTHGDTSGLTGTPSNLFDWNRRGEGVYGPATVTSRYTMRQTSVYGATRLQLSDRLKLIAGTRVFWQDYDYLERWNGGSYGTTSSEDAVFTPYGGVVYDIDKVHSAYASYSTIYKPQTVRDRNGAVLDPTEGTNYEVGLKSEWLGGRLNTAIALYQIRQDNLSESDLGYAVPGTVDTPAYRAVKGAKTRGVDVEMSGALSDSWNVSASWTFGQTKNAEGERITTTFPRHMVKLWTSYRLPGDWSRLTVGGGVNWQSKTYSTVEAWQIGRDLYWEQKAYAVAGLMARYEFNDQLTATVNVNNLFDKKYVASVSDWWYSGNYGAPRSVFLNVKYQF